MTEEAKKCFIPIGKEGYGYCEENNCHIAAGTCTECFEFKLVKFKGDRFDYNLYLRVGMKIFFVDKERFGEMSIYEGLTPEKIMVEGNTATVTFDNGKVLFLAKDHFEFEGARYTYPANAKIHYIRDKKTFLVSKEFQKLQRKKVEPEEEGEKKYIEISTEILSDIVGLRDVKIDETIFVPTLKAPTKEEYKASVLAQKSTKEPKAEPKTKEPEQKVKEPEKQKYLDISAKILAEIIFLRDITLPDIDAPFATNEVKSAGKAALPKKDVKPSTTKLGGDLQFTNKQLGETKSKGKKTKSLFEF